MEHRYSERIAVTLPVDVYYQGNPPINAQVRNLAREGMFIDLAGETLPRGCLLRLVFKIPDQDTQAFRVPAMVIHNNHGGIGVMFQIIPARLEKALDRCIEAATGPSKIVAFGGGD